MRSTGCSAFVRRFLLVLLAGLAPPVLGQTPTASVSVAKPSQAVEGEVARAVSPANPWVSAQVSYRFAGNVEESFVVSARALYWLDQEDEPRSPRGFGLPVMGNFSGISASTPPEKLDEKLQGVAGSGQGLYAGVYPYWRFYKQSLVSPTLYAGLVPFRLNAAKVADGSGAMLYQGNVSVGVELAVGKKDGRSLLTVSATGTYAVPYNHKDFTRAFPEGKFQRWSAELTTVLPIGSGIGILAEGIFPGSATPGFRAGLILASEIGK